MTGSYSFKDFSENKREACIFRKALESTCRHFCPLNPGVNYQWLLLILIILI